MPALTCAAAQRALQPQVLDDERPTVRTMPHPPRSAECWHIVAEGMFNYLTIFNQKVRQKTLPKSPYLACQMSEENSSRVA